ncbi:type II secretion system F family protein [Candidatus Poriferisodalis sp.]|uniref:type II secretion system F family protein n=1 Tax=Candidatus Poriferisodalis sp. TaxID=3101277 RepID=UPI003B0298A8
MARAIAFGVLATAGLCLVLFSGPLSRLRRRGRGRASGAAVPPAERRRQQAGGTARTGAPAAPAAAAAGGGLRRISPLMAVQIVAAAAGGLAGWAATGLLGMMMLLGGLGALLPPFMAAPARRRRQTRLALAWSTWSRQLAELARAGSGLVEALRGSVEHAPAEIAAVVARCAATAELHGLEAALDELSEAGAVWEPEVAAGLRMAATSGGSVADPLLDLCSRIEDVVDLHRSRTEAVVQLWTQTIALLCLEGGVVALMYRNNPAYFDPYESGTGQLVFVAIAALLLLSTSFLVYHSVVRDEHSVLVPPRRRNRARDPL